MRLIITHNDHVCEALKRKKKSFKII